MKKLLNEYIPQVLLIVFSVVLGLFLNQKMVDYNDQKKADQLLSMIESEIKSNQEIVADYYPYHAGIYEKLDSLKNDEAFLKEFYKDRFVLFNQLLTRSTFMGQSLSRSAWETMKLNPLVSEISFDKLRTLTETYVQQKGTYSPFDKLDKLINTPFLNAPENAKENLQLMSISMRELVAREKQLLDYYKITLEELKE